MLLPFTDSLVVTKRCDPECAALADRHYSRQKVGAREFVGNGRPLVIRDSAGTLVFGWLWCLPGMRADGESGYNCTIFRNESARLSSDVILECERIAFAHWGPNRLFTYVNPSRIRSVNPGACFKFAGWKFVRTTAKGLHLLAKGLV